MCWACPRRRPRLAPSKTSCESLQRNFEALAPETPFARARTLVRGSLPRHARHARSALGTRGTRPFPPRRAPNATTFPLRNCLAQAHVQRQCRQSFVPGAGEEDSAQGALPASQGARHWRTPLTTRRARTACTFPPRVTTHKTARPLPLGRGHLSAQCSPAPRSSTRAGRGEWQQLCTEKKGGRRRAYTEGRRRRAKESEDGRRRGCGRGVACWCCHCGGGGGGESGPDQEPSAHHRQQTS